jgi:hypothetical protein
MFGGVPFLCDGRMCCGIVGNDLVVREDALRDWITRSVAFTEQNVSIRRRRSR